MIRFLKSEVKKYEENIEILKELIESNQKEIDFLLDQNKLMKQSIEEKELEIKLLKNLVKLGN